MATPTKDVQRRFTEMALLGSVLAIILFIILPPSSTERVHPSTTHHHSFALELVAEGLRNPFSMAFLPDGGMLITERGRGVLPPRLMRKPLGMQPAAVGGLHPPRSEVYLLHDVLLDPLHAENRIIYLSYATQEEVDGKKLFGVEVLRAELREFHLHDVQTIFRLPQKSANNRIFGGRLLFAGDGSLFVVVSDLNNFTSLEAKDLRDLVDQSRAQDRLDHTGSVLRIHTDGSAPKDNPWPDSEVALPELYTYGHRNMQGLAMNPQTNQIYAHEHGPQGGDELNLIQAGGNYGWPAITYGKQYGTGTDIGMGAERDDVQPPLYYWMPSIAPSGMAFYTGDEFPKWRGHLFIGSLKFGQLNRLELRNNKVVDEEHNMLRSRMTTGVRDVRQGPEGTLYLLTLGGKIYSLHNTDESQKDKKNKDKDKVSTSD